MTAGRAYTGVEVAASHCRGDRRSPEEGPLSSPPREWGGDGIPVHVGIEDKANDRHGRRSLPDREGRPPVAPYNLATI